MKTTLCLLTLVLAAAFGAACAGPSTPNNAARQAPAASNTSQAAQNATPASAPDTNGRITTPTDAYRAAYEARKNKDVAALRGLMSKDLLEFLGLVGEDEKKSLDDVLRELCEKPQAATAEVRNEKINGDWATLEYLDEKGKWSTMDLEKEDGRWKLTAPKADTPSTGPDSDRGDKKGKG